MGCEIQLYFTIINVFKRFQKLKILIFTFLFSAVVFFFHFFKCTLDLPLHFSLSVVNNELQGCVNACANFMYIKI